MEKQDMAFAKDRQRAMDKADLELEGLRAGVRKLNAEAALLEGQAAHEQAQAEQVRASASVQRVNVQIADQQLAMQRNMVRLQTVQIDADIRKLDNGGAAPN